VDCFWTCYSRYIYTFRNKILGVSLIIEAVLYDAQTESTLGFRNFKMLREISNHCTMCHNCSIPCPVNIDFGEVTLSIRDLLVQRNKSKFKFITSLTLFYLKRRNYYINKLFRIALLKIGYASQRTGYYLNKPFAQITKKLIPFVAQILESRLPRAGKETIREIFSLKGSGFFFSLQNPDMDLKKSVLYFPGCGSERMFSEISIAVLALLYRAGIRVVIPPEYLCCGYPLLANGKVKSANIKSYENRVIFHRIADISGYMEIQDIIVSCGTCYEMLAQYHVENIFPNSAVLDINEFIVREKLYSITPDEEFLYHDPCHSPLKHYGCDETLRKLFSRQPSTVPNCCGEGGTLALSTPLISNSLRKRKQANTAQITAENRITVLTTCPSCVQGLSRITDSPHINGMHLTVYLAEKALGTPWKKDFIAHVKKNHSVEEILL